MFNMLNTYCRHIEDVLKIIVQYVKYILNTCCRYVETYTVQYMLNAYYNILYTCYTYVVYVLQKFQGCNTKMYMNAQDLEVA